MTIRIFISAFLLVVIITISGLFDPVNNRVYDYYLHLNKKGSVNQNIVIVAIDEKSIKEIGYWPWSRTQYIKLLNKIIKDSPAVIGIHISFTETQGKTADDQELFRILKSYPDVVIGTKLIKSKVNTMQVIVPEKNLFPGVKQGHTVFTEQDVIRSFPPFKVVPAFSLQVLNLYYHKNPDLLSLLPDELKNLLSRVQNPDYSISQNILIDYKRTPDKFKHYSFVDVIRGDIPTDSFKNKIVLIGITDRYLTPYLANPISYQEKGVASPLVEFQAQTIDSLMDYRGLKTYPPWIINLISTVIAVLFLLFVSNKRVIVQGLFFAGIFIVLVAINFILFNYYATWFPPAFLLALITLIFGLSTYLTINTVDTELIKTLRELLDEEQITQIQLPSNISHKVSVLNGLINIIANDRKTIRAIIYGITNPFVVIDNTGTILWSNGCFSDLFKDNLVLNENVQNLVSGLNIDEIIKVMDAESSYRADVSIFNKEYACLINYINSQDKQYVVVFNDITELKEIDRLKTDMMRMVSHELKVPLMQVLLAAENLPYRETSELVSQDALNILNAAELMKSTINNFLQLNKLEASIVDVKIDRSDLINVIQRSIELQNLIAEKHNIEMIFEHDDILKVLINNNLMEIVINNLLSNAIKYSYDNGKVIIRVTNVSEKVKVEIIDSGIGIKKEEISQLTEKFYRASNNFERNISGTGLGLSIVDLILTIHNTKLIIESEYNVGTTFSFELESAKENILPD